MEIIIINDQDVLVDLWRELWCVTLLELSMEKQSGKTKKFE